MQPDSSQYLFDIRQAIERIQTFIVGVDFAAYRADEQLKSTVERQLITIGEAISQFSRVDSDRARRLTEHSRIIGMRNILVHAYGDVDDTLVWAAVTTRLTVLHNEAGRLLEDDDRGHT
jgi:uncharacterized protein with HEPN domain